MKRSLFITGILLSALCSIGQEPADALRYSWLTTGGTARAQAVGGAMGSLGGDLSALFVNPAGLGFYRTGDFVFTPAYMGLKNKSTYLNHTEQDAKHKLTWGTTGFVIGSGNGSDRKHNHVFALAISRIADFNSRILYRGVNYQSSYSQKFLEEIKNNNDKDANHVASGYPFGTSLAFNTYWIDTVGGGTSGNYQFQTRAPIATGLIQEEKVNTKGGISEIAIGGATNFHDKIMFGATIGIPILHYVRESTFSEADLTTNPNNKFDYAAITENLSTDGAGIHILAGMIYKPTEYIRLGFSIHSPSFYTLTDKYTAVVGTNTESYHGNLNQSSDLLNNNAPSTFKYNLMTPYHILASASYVLREVEDVRKQRGFLTADIEYVNYKASSFSGDGSADASTKSYLKTLNKAIDNAYRGAFNFRAGGELKFTTIMVRAGLAYYGNPYQDIHGEKGSRLQFSGGLGYRNKGMFIDATYVYSAIKDVHYAYRLQDSPYSGANIKGTGGNVVVTVGFKI